MGPDELTRKHAVIGPFDPLPPGGEAVLGPEPELEFVLFGARRANGVLSVVDVEGMPFKKAIRAQTLVKPPYVYNIQTIAHNKTLVLDQDLLVLRFYIRCVESLSGKCESQFIFERSDGNAGTRAVANPVEVTGDGWHHVQVAFESKGSYAPGEARLVFRMGYDPQTFEIGGIQLVNYRRAYDKYAFHQVHPQLTYEGREPDAPWRSEAEARIEAIRKADMAVRVVDSSGSPIAGADVSIKMQRHAFHFGSMYTRGYINQYVYGTADRDGIMYAEQFAKLFNIGVPENDLKWPYLESGEGWRIERLNTEINWLRQNGIDVRGHTLVWQRSTRVPPDVAAMIGNPNVNKDYLRRRINNHITQTVSAFRGRVVEWDVINEAFRDHAIVDILGYDEIFEWLRLAKEADPDVKVFVNDNGIERDKGDWEEAINFYVKLLQDAKKRGVVVDGLGMQAHMEWKLTSPAKMLDILDRFVGLVDRVKITEFDMASGDEQLYADYLRDFYTVLFSHPLVDGILMWGFWDGAHWRNNAPIFRKDWSLKPSGQMYIDLVFNKWWTDEAGVTDEDGMFKVRGFLGDYEVTVRYEGREVKQAVSLPKEGLDVTIALDCCGD